MMASIPGRPWPVLNVVVKFWQSSGQVIEKLDMESLLSQDPDVAQQALEQLSTAHDVHLKRRIDVDTTLAGYNPSLGDHTCRPRTGVVEALKTLSIIPTLTLAVAGLTLEVCHGTTCGAQLLDRWKRFVHAAQKGTRAGLWGDLNMVQRMNSLHLGIVTTLTDSHLYICKVPDKHSGPAGEMACRVCHKEKTSIEGLWAAGEVSLKSFLASAIYVGLIHSRQRRDMQNDYDTLRPYQNRPDHPQDLTMRDNINERLCRYTRSMVELLLEGTASSYSSLFESGVDIEQALLHIFPALTSQLQAPLSARSSPQPDVPLRSCEDAEGASFMEETHETSTAEDDVDSRASSACEGRYVTPRGDEPLVEKPWAGRTSRDSSEISIYSSRAAPVSEVLQSQDLEKRARRYEQSRRVSSILSEPPFDYDSLRNVNKEVNELRAPVPRSTLVQGARVRVPWTPAEDTRLLQLLDKIGVGQWKLIKYLDEKHPRGSKLDIRTTVDLKDRHRTIKNIQVRRANRPMPVANGKAWPGYVKVEDTVVRK